MSAFAASGARFAKGGALALALAAGAATGARGAVGEVSRGALASITPGGLWPTAFDDSCAWFSLTRNFVSTSFPGFATLAGAARVTRVFVVTPFDALAVLAETLERRPPALLADFAFADLAALLFAADRDGREAVEPATALRLREGVDPVDALLFFETVLDDFLLAFFRAAMAQTLQTQDNTSPA